MSTIRTARPISAEQSRSETGERPLSAQPEASPAPHPPDRLGSLTSQRQPLDEELAAAGDPLMRLLTVAEVAAMLNVPRKWVYRRVVLKPPNGIPHVKMGKYVRFRESDLRNYVERLRRS